MIKSRVGDQRQDTVAPVKDPGRRSNAPGLPDELFFSIITRRLLRRGEFSSREDLADKIMNFIEVYDDTAKPFRWTYDGSPLKAA